jgi:hypothetical protein
MTFNDERYKTARARKVPAFIATMSVLKQCIEDLKMLDGDNEVQHIREDQIHLAVLSAIGAGVCVDEPASLAALAATTQSIDFERWHS